MKAIFDNRLLMLRPDDIICKKSPRTATDPGDLSRLRASIAANGILMPLCVRKTESGKFLLISGYRRLSAAKELKLRRVPCITKNVDDKSAILLSLAENIERKPLSFFEQAKIIKTLLKNYCCSEAEIAAALGISSVFIEQMLSLDGLDENSKNRIIGANLSEKTALFLTEVKEERRSEIIDRIIARSLSGEEIKEAVNPKPAPPPEEPEKTPYRRFAIGDIRLFSNSLLKLVETLKNAGVDPKFKKNETDKYIEYKIRINKTKTDAPSGEQLKIC